MEKRAYPVLDALRGAAAVSILFYHMGGIARVARNPGGHISHGYLAVDFFFMLSGFVVANAYEAKLNSGWSVKGFMGARLRRLYPVYALGVGLGLTTCCIANTLLHGALTPGQAGGMACLLVLALSFLPVLQHGGMDAFPLNGPSWSLSHEILANLVYAGLCRRLRTPSLLVLSALGAALCLGLIVRGAGLDAGSTSSGYLAGLGRVLYSFPLGVAILRMHRAGLTRIPARAHPLVLAMLLVGLLVFPSLGLGFDRVYDAACVFIAFPALLIASIETVQPNGYGARLGKLSYPLYATHLSLLPAWKGLAASTPPLLMVVIGITLSLALALAVQHGFEPLVERLRGRRARLASGAETAYA